MDINMSEEWTFEVPTESGEYLFYGDTYHKKDEPTFRAELYKIVCHVTGKGAESIAYVSSNGDFFFPESQNWHGKFKKINMNDMPTL